MSRRKSQLHLLSLDSLLHQGANLYLIFPNDLKISISKANACVFASNGLPARPQPSLLQALPIIYPRSLFPVILPNPHHTPKA